jgi:protein MAK11
MRRAASSEAKASVSKKRKVQLLDLPRSSTGKPKNSPKRSTVSKAKVPPDVKVKKGKGKGPAAPPKDIANVAKDEDNLPLLPKTFKIIAGSYEKLLYGLEAAIEEDEPGSSARRLQLKPIFIFPAHVSCVKAVAASPSGGKWLATGSADEIIKVWDLRRRKEIGGLIHHEGKLLRFHLSCI